MKTINHKSLKHARRPCLAFVLLSVLLSTAWASQTTAPAHAPGEIAPLNTPFDMPQIEPPTFPDRTFDIRDHGAAGDGNTMNTKAFAPDLRK